MDFELNLEKFSGPISKLLELIDDRKIEITEISLSAVVDDFLVYVRGLERVEMPLLADFIVVASRLILLKSKALLPNLELSEEEEEDIKDLERRLLAYRELKPAIRNISQIWKGGRIEFSRSYFLQGGLFDLRQDLRGEIFSPGNNLSGKLLFESMNRLLKSFSSLDIEKEIIRDKVISLEEKVEEIMAKLEKAGEHNFRDLTQTKDRAEAIIIFLAILHLAREQLVHLEQNGFFSDIIIRKKTRERNGNKVEI